MTWLDIAVVAIVALSLLFAYVRGIVRTLIGLVAWIAGLVLGIGFASSLAAQLPTFGLAPDTAVPVSQIVVFALIFVAAMVCGALIAWPLAGVVKAAGLTFLDRFLGGAVRHPARRRAARGTGHGRRDLRTRAARLVAEFGHRPGPGEARGGDRAVAAARVGRATQFFGAGQVGQRLRGAARTRPQREVAPCVES
jgi:hypothetical protein